MLNRTAQPAIGYLLSCLVVAGLAASCAKSVDGEAKRWTQANRTVDELTTLYPSFKTPLETQRATAKTAMSAAEKEGDAEKRADKMSEANKLITSGFVGQLRKVDGEIKAIRKQAIQATSKAKDDTDRLGAKQAADNAERVFVEIKQRLARGAKDPAAAATVLKKVTADLRSAKDGVRSVTRAMAKKRPTKGKGKVGASTTKPGSGATVVPPKTGTPPKPAQWTCGYCGSANHGDKLSCKGCGAAKSKPKAKKK